MDKILLIVRTYPHIFPSHIENQAAWVNRCKVAYQHFIYDPRSWIWYMYNYSIAFQYCAMVIIPFSLNSFLFFPRIELSVKQINFFVRFPTVINRLKEKNLKFRKNKINCWSLISVAVILYCRKICNKIRVMLLLFEFAKVFHHFLVETFSIHPNIVCSWMELCLLFTSLRYNTIIYWWRTKVAYRKFHVNGLRFDQKEKKKKEKIGKKVITNIIRNIVSMSRTFFWNDFYH